VSRTSNDEYKDGRLIHGYDYDNQAWVVDGKYVGCGHPSGWTADATDALMPERRRGQPRQKQSSHSEAGQARCERASVCLATFGLETCQTQTGRIVRHTIT
jgi:hypothetical protein